ncbi:MAG: ABC transporter permease [Thiothrix sp.]|nr:MAG: ABC transporter permease [Thiothrix sp.]
MTYLNPSTKSLRFWGLLPSYLIMLCFLIIPIGIVLIVSFSTKGPYGGFEYTFSTESYQQLLFNKDWDDKLEFNPQYLIIIGRTALLAFLSTVICLVIGFPVAYYIAQQRRKLRILLIYLVTLPFWVSMIVRVYAWMIILGNDGVIDKSVQLLGFPSTGSLLFTNSATLIGMVYSYVPLMILPLYASIEKLDSTLIEASHDLYGSRWVTLYRVILPLTQAGMISGAILVFVPCLGAFLEPVLLGGGKQLMMGNLIAMQFGSARNWPFGSAIAIVLLVLVLIVLLMNALRVRHIKLETEHG